VFDCYGSIRAADTAPDSAPVVGEAGWLLQVRMLAETKIADFHFAEGKDY
jgi:hypothetical protein